jgi:hypothetical protein
MCGDNPGVACFAEGGLAMDAARLNEVIERCMARTRDEDREAHYKNLAEFLGVEPITLRRWRHGEVAVPRAVEVVLEIYDAFPERAGELTAASYGPGGPPAT